MKYSEWSRKFDAGNEEADKKYDAEMEQLKKKLNADRSPFQANQIIECPIVSPPIQKIISLKAAPVQKVIECQIISP